MNKYTVRYSLNGELKIEKLTTKEIKSLLHNPFVNSIIETKPSELMPTYLHELIGEHNFKFNYTANTTTTAQDKAFIHFH